MQVTCIMNITQEEKVHLQDSGLKGTKPRLAVLHVLEEQHRPLDVAEILHGLEEHHIAADQATVYRILDTFTQKGLIERLEFHEGKFRYERAGEDHHHLICESCGKVEDMSDCNIGELEKDVKKKKGFQVKRHALEFYGLCQQCQH